ncbi:hypothetical protein [Natronocalculus amylovorans]|uniref:DUF8124 domain-containing protein n=1 Tax=Natronocalculus amylovorans TaxID=2917812 RepID=A0AAE3FZ33_9EURY|nr:hypothetical protein [Natronocalculus amylovorans]MCL9817987.1 hypothetical protein [Natronocalculus amylovorans]
MTDHSDGDTFGVQIHRTLNELQFIVQVPSDIDSGWTDPDTFQTLVENHVWNILDQQAVLEQIVSMTEPGDTVSLGTISLLPNGDVTSHSLQLE